MASMTTVRAGVSIGRGLTAGSLAEIEAQSGGERLQAVVGIRPLAPDLKKAILRRPVTVGDGEAPRAVDERRRPPDALLGRLGGDGVEHTGDRSAQHGSERSEIKLDAKRAGLGGGLEDAVRNRAELGQGLEDAPDLLLQDMARDQRQRLGDRRIYLAQIVHQLAALLPDLPVGRLELLERGPDDVGQDAPTLVEEEVAQGSEAARKVVVEPADEVSDAPAGAPLAQISLHRVVGGLVLPGADAAREVVAAEVHHRVHRLARLAGRLGADANTPDAQGRAVRRLARLVEPA